MRKNIIFVYPNEKTFALEFFPKAYFYLELVDGGLHGSAAIIHWGPGYHKFLCNFIDILSKQFKVSFLVDDESGYFEDRDFQKLREKYLQKLETHIKACFEENLFLLGIALNASFSTTEDIYCAA